MGSSGIHRYPFDHLTIDTECWPRWLTTVWPLNWPFDWPLMIMHTDNWLFTWPVDTGSWPHWPLYVTYSWNVNKGGHKGSVVRVSLSTWSVCWSVVKSAMGKWRVVIKVAEVAKSGQWNNYHIPLTNTWHLTPLTKSHLTMGHLTTYV
jgi:hypothetical protein